MMMRLPCDPMLSRASSYNAWSWRRGWRCQIKLEHPDVSPLIELGTQILQQKSFYAARGRKICSGVAGNVDSNTRLSSAGELGAPSIE